MWRALMSSRFASWVVGKVSLPKERQVQHELDLQRLYILTQLARAGAAGKQANLQALMLKSQSLEPSTIRAEVETALTGQVLAQAQELHEHLTQAGDPVYAAEGMAAAAAELQRRKARDASGFSKLLKGLRGDGKDSGSKQAQADHGAEEAAAAGPGPGSSSSSGSGGSTGRIMSQAELAATLRRRGGFSLSLRPSSVPHPEAGTGLFLEGEARAGSVVAYFPGVLYGRTQLAHMPNYPKVDTGNPYLSCRYDQSIVDSKPWGRGDPGDGDGRSTSSSSSSSSIGSSSSSAAGTAASSSGGDRISSASSSSSSPSWWGWAGPLSAALGYLEGRHPLALGHFANHPGQGQAPNVLEASLDVPLDHPLLASRPWLRAYLPSLQPPLHYDPFNKAAGNDGDPDDDDDDDEDEDDDDEEDDRKRDQAHKAKRAGAAAAAAGNTACGDGTAAVTGANSLPERPRAHGELRRRQLLEPPGGVVRLLVLVATRGIRDGEELLQNYRMNPHVRRPDWYVVHDAEAEERRWAKIRALDLGFKGGKSSAATAGGAGGGSGGSGPASPAA